MASATTRTQLLESSWQAQLGGEFDQPYMQQLKRFLREQKDAKKVIYPHSNDIFKAFEYTPIDQVKVVILGQDPYHGVRQAHGLCFSVPGGVAIPPSLLNIYKELHDDLGIPPAAHGSLVSWAQQGVLLLNSVLTVEQGAAAAHQGKGWETFTDKVIALLNEQEQPIAFVLWGAYAQRKGKIIDPKRHMVISSVHPSPLSAYRGFFGSRPFSKINDYLIAHGQTPINWALPPNPK
jgi:uracil-DNA glycosylase